MARGTPTISVTSAAGQGAAALLAEGADDTGGSFRLWMGSGGRSSGVVAQLTFSKPFVNTPTATIIPSPKATDHKTSAALKRTANTPTAVANTVATVKVGISFTFSAAHDSAEVLVFDYSVSGS